ncbi:hypothetical protein [[Clostridium] symbiosum]|uniref:hypothetical protein n=1 Tax=Clostridium symbiosum TaxID=1512 RepID=UPI003218FFCB
MAVGNIDLNQEIESWKSAVYGKDVRAANVAAFEKIQGTVNDTVQNVNQAAEDSASAAHNAQAAVDSIQAAVTTVTGKAAEAATSASQAADSQAAADSSKTAAAQSETNAAASAAEARQIAEGFGGFDGTAASVKATDTYGLVVDALGESTTQALIDAVANKVINELIAKSNIVNNLLATEVGTVLSGALGPIIDQRLTDLMNKYTQLNGESFIVRDGIRGNDDLNNIVVPGYYQLSSSASNSVANPAFRSTSIVEVITTDSYIVQRQTGPSESKYRFRDSNSNWGAWL